MESLLNIVYIIGGLALILIGANALTDGSSTVAKRFGLSDLIIGLTVVAFGTSMPELVISVASAIGGSGELSIGNVVGSNIFNILVIIGVTAIVKPVTVERSVMTREIPMVLISSIALLIMGNKCLVNGASESILTRTNGLTLLLFFTIFMWYMLASAKRDNAAEAAPQGDTSSTPQMSMLKAVIWILGGLAMLIFGGDIFVRGASGIAATLGVSKAIIGLTIAATGTSLPELATSLVAAAKGKTGIAIGNVVGSCIFNVFSVLGFSATISSLPFGAIGNLDLLMLLGASIFFLVFGWLFGKRTFTRAEGSVMTLAYVAYITILILKA